MTDNENTAAPAAFAGGAEGATAPQTTPQAPLPESAAAQTTPQAPVPAPAAAQATPLAAYPPAPAGPAGTPGAFAAPPAGAAEPKRNGRKIAAGVAAGAVLLGATAAGSSFATYAIVRDGGDTDQVNDGPGFSTDQERQGPGGQLPGGQGETDSSSQSGPGGASLPEDGFGADDSATSGDAETTGSRSLAPVAEWIAVPPATPGRSREDGDGTITGGTTTSTDGTEVTGTQAAGVVLVETAGSDGELLDAGYGLTVTADGLILTQARLLEGAVDVFVTTADGDAYLASVTATDTRSDVALLTLAGASGLTVSAFEDDASAVTSPDASAPAQASDDDGATGITVSTRTIGFELTDDYAFAGEALVLDPASFI